MRITDLNDLVDRLLSIPKVAKRFGVDRRTIWRWIAAGTLRQPVYVGMKLPRLAESHIEAHIQQLNREVRR